MKQVQADTQVMVVIEIDKMSERLKKAYSLLVAIQKGLNAVSFCSLDGDFNIYNYFFSPVFGQETCSFPTILLHI